MVIAAQLRYDGKMHWSVGWTHAVPVLVAAFLASLVECVEALTVILAVGGVRGWRGALRGTAAGIAVLLLTVAVLGRAVLSIPLHIVQLAVGTLLLLFGLRWLRKAILRAAGLLPLHDEQAAFSSRLDVMRTTDAGRAGDKAAFTACFQIVMLEGAEVVFIVIALGAGGSGLLAAASLGAIAALATVSALGFAVHRPLARVPENTLKFIVGILLSSFGTFWVGEGMSVNRPGGDWSLAGLLGVFLALALLSISVCRRRAKHPGAIPG